MGKLIIAAYLPEGHRIDEIEMPVDQVAEGSLVSFSCEESQEMSIIGHVHPSNTRRTRNPTRNFGVAAGLPASPGTPKTR
ncbi:MAG: hypothetical protein NTW03_15870, partial [Verrucomicrobia bacterium]|nr:hypothetical protein [Verrucomicrobiota bacterium]